MTNICAFSALRSMVSFIVFLRRLTPALTAAQHCVPAPGRSKQHRAKKQQEQFPTSGPSPFVTQRGACTDSLKMVRMVAWYAPRKNFGGLFITTAASRLTTRSLKDAALRHSCCPCHSCIVIVNLAILVVATRLSNMKMTPEIHECSNNSNSVFQVRMATHRVVFACLVSTSECIDFPFLRGVREQQVNGLQVYNHLYLTSFLEFSIFI